MSSSGKETSEKGENQTIDPEQKCLKLREDLRNALPYVEEVRGITSSKIRSFRRNLRQKIESLGYEIQPGDDVYHYPEGEIDSDYREVIGCIVGKKGGERGRCHPAVYIGIVLILIGLLMMFVSLVAGLTFIIIGVLCFIVPYKLGIQLYYPSKGADRLIVYFEGVESSGVKKREVKVDEEVGDLKGVELKYRIIELDFDVGGDLENDVNAIVEFLERYRARTA